MIYELECLANHPEFPENKIIFKKWCEIRKKIWDNPKRTGKLIAVYYKGSIIFTGHIGEVSDEVKVSVTHIRRLIKDDKKDKYGRSYMYIEQSESSE